jgi:hypothetical protein
VAFSSIPDRPTRARQFAKIVHLISFNAGKINEVRHLDKVRSLASCLTCELFYGVGDFVGKTVDIRTDVGYVLLCNEDRNILEQDYTELLRLQPDILDIISTGNDADCRNV